MLIKYGTYIGDGTSSHAITGIGFKPDMVIAKPAITSDGMAFRTKDMDAGKSTYIRNDWGYETTFIQSFEVNGFTVGSDSRINGNNSLFYYIAIAEDSANDFKVFTFTGDSTDGKALTGFGFQPAFVFIKGIQSLTGAMKFSSATDTSMVFSGGGTQDRTDLIVSLDADGCTINNGSVGSANLVNPSVACFGFAFKSVTGKVKVGTYTGNGVDNTVIDPGFPPGLVLIKSSTSQDPCFKTPVIQGDNSIGFDYAQVNDSIQSMNSSGFTLGTRGNVNSNTVVYNYLVVYNPTNLNGLSNKIRNISVGNGMSRSELAS
jgi:hypothetical protein